MVSSSSTCSETTALPTPEEIVGVLNLAQALETHTEQGHSKPVLLTIGEQEYELSETLLKTLSNTAQALAHGQGVSVISHQRLLSTHQAANLLNVSHPTLIKILEREELPYEMRGSHRRVKLEDLVAFQESLKVRRAQALDRLQQQAQEDDLYSKLDQAE